MKVLCNPGAALPRYAKPGDAGLDLHAQEFCSLGFGDRYVMPTGIRMAIPEGHFGMIVGRSGLAARQGLHVYQGTVDAGYRGELKVVMQSLGNIHEFIRINQGDRIAQLVIVPYLRAQLLEVKDPAELGETERGANGFGSSGR